MGRAWMLVIVTVTALTIIAIMRERGVTEPAEPTTTTAPLPYARISNTDYNPDRRAYVKRTSRFLDENAYAVFLNVRSIQASVPAARSTGSIHMCVAKCGSDGKGTSSGDGRRRKSDTIPVCLFAVFITTLGNGEEPRVFAKYHGVVKKRIRCGVNATISLRYDGHQVEVYADDLLQYVFLSSLDDVPPCAVVQPLGDKGSFVRDVVLQHVSIDPVSFHYPLYVTMTSFFIKTIVAAIMCLCLCVAMAYKRRTTETAHFV
eukprot:GEMP01053922.1.p1 GENE.GEMP01053922.1~~GEMP01053922.1.p1  ORF type:complete len:260 (+),score=62.01 GEMP01053922.1:316-1095(+)